MSEFKMSDYFDKPVEFVGDTIECPDFAYATTTCEWEVNGIDYGHAIAHAINNHDKLVEENQRLTAIATKHATRADELWEALEMCIEALERSYDATEWPADGSSQQEVTAVQCREGLDRTKIDSASNSNDG